MKKLSFLLIAIMAVVVILPSCNNDDDILGPPSLDFKGGADYISADATIATNSFFKVGIAATANAESNKKLKTLKLTRTLDNTTFIDTTYSIDETMFNADFQFNAQNDGQVETILFVLTDDAGMTDSKSLTITYETVGVAVTKNSDVLMGSFNDDNGSFYSTVNKEVYSITEASAIMSDIDFLFYLGATNASSIASPFDADAQVVYPAIADWTTKNETLFATTDITVEQFDAITDSYVFPEFADEMTGITQLEANNVIMFLTVNDKFGLIKVNSINGRGDFISLDIIVAE